MSAEADDSVSSESELSSSARRLGPLAFVGIVLVYLVIIKGVGLLATSGLHGFDQGHFLTGEQIARGLLLPVGLSAVFVYAVVAALGWWRPVLVDRQPVHRWLWVVPMILVLASAAAVNYGGLTDKSLGSVVMLLLATLLVGFAEEGMFRGIGVTVFRAGGYREGRVALWSSVIFGAAHLTNAIGGGGGAALAQAIAVSFAGYFFYLTRRVSGGLLVPAIVHGLFDFSITSDVITKHSYAGGVAPILAYLVIAIILIGRRHRIVLSTTQTTDRTDWPG